MLLVAAFALLCFTAWAVEQMISGSFRIRRGDVTAGGSTEATSPSYKSTDAAGASGGEMMTGASEITFGGVSNVISHPNTITTLSASNDTTVGQLQLSWTAPVAYGSSGTASGYVVKYAVTPIATEAHFDAASTFAQAWAPAAPGSPESHLLTGLSANTTYYVAVKAQDEAGNTGYLSNAASASTLTNAITNGVIRLVTSGAIRADWDSLAGNGGSEGYRLEVSTAADFTGTVRSSETASVAVTTLTVSGLTVGQTYFVRAGGLNWQGTPNFVSLGSTMTVSTPPTSPVISQVFESSMTISWGAVGGLGYLIEASTAANFSGTLKSSATADAARTQLTLESLAPNTTYFVRAGALYASTTNYADTTPVSSATLTSPLAAPQVYRVFTSSAIVNWAPFTAGSGSGTAEGYRLEASTSADFATIAASSETADVAFSTLTLVGLNTGETYFVRVGGVNWNGVPNFTSLGSVTTGAGTAPSGAVIVSVSSSAISAGWTPVTETLGYTLDVSTDAGFNPVAVSSVAAGASISSLTVSSLQPNTTYYVRVGSLWNGTTAYAATTPVSTATLTAPIAGTQFLQVHVTSVTVGWTALGSADAYRLEAYTDPGFTSFAGSSVTASVAQSTLTISGLAAHTTYYFRVAGVNHNNVATWTTIGGTQTIAGLAPTNAALAMVGQSSMTVTWTGVTDHDGYVIEAATDAGFTVPISSVTAAMATTSLSFNAGSLQPNTTYFVRVGALYNGATRYADTTPASTSTLTNPITGTSFLAVHVASVTVGWTALGSADAYRLDAYSDAGFTSLAGSSVTTSVAQSTLTVTGLNAHTTYYFRVAGMNHNNVAVWTTVGGTQTIAGLAPTNAALSMVGQSSMTVTWTGVTDHNGYVIEAATDVGFTVPITSVTALTPATGLSFNLGALQPNTTYFVRVGALYNGATSYAATVPASTSTLASYPAGGQIYATFTDSVTANWTAFAAGSGANTADGYVLDASSTAFNGTGTIYSSTTFTATLSTLTVSGLTTNITYTLRVGVVNHNGVVSYSALGTTTTSAGPAPTNPLITAVFASSMTATWGAVTSDSGYVLQASTAVWPNSFTGNVSSITTNGAATTLSFNPGDLLPNTTYFVRVGSLWNGATSYANTTPASTSTLTSPIVGTSFTAVYVSSVTVGWTALGSADAYRLEAYTDAGFTSLAGSSVTTSVSLSTLTVSGLSAHTTYYFRVAGVNHNNVATWTTVGGTQTIAGLAPTNALLSMVGQSSMTVTWTGVTDHNGYVLEAATDGGFTVPITSVTAATSATSLSFNVGSLQPNTTYFVRVGALYNGATTYAPTTPASTSTLTSPITGTSFVGVFVTSATVGWTALGSADAYRLEAYADAGFTSLAGSSVTTSLTQSTLTVSGLNAHTTYYFRVAGMNHNSVATWTTVGGTQTLAGLAPTNAALSMVGQSSMTVTWTGVTDHNGYVLEAATDVGFTVPITSVTLATSATSLSFNLAALAPNTTYFVRVGALYNGATTYAATVPASTSTLASSPTGGQIYAIYTDSITANWTAFAAGSGANTADGYVLEASSTAFNGSGTVYSSTTFTAARSTLTVTGLTTNVTYTLRVGAINHNGVVSYSGLGTTTTSAGPAPTNPLITAVFASSMTATWGSVTSDSGYVLQASTAAWPNSFTGNVSSITTNGSATALSFNLGDLLPNTTYFVRVGSLWNGATTYANTTPASTSTLTSPIAGTSFVGVFVTSTTVGWTALGSADAYRLEAFTDAGFTSVAGSSVTTSVAQSTLTITGLSAHTTYYFRVAGVNHNNVATWTVVGGTQTLAGLAPTNVALSMVGQSSMTATWTGVTDHNGYVLQAATDAGFAAPVSSVTLAPSATSLSFNLASLAPNTTYFVRVGALYNGATMYASAAPSSTSTLTSPLTGLATTQVAITSVTVSWAAMAAGSGANTATGYRLEASLAADFSAIAASSQTADVSLSTLTLTGLSSASSFYLRAGAVNWNGVVTYTVFGPVTTQAGLAPGSPVITAVYVSSVAVAWTLAGGAESYVVEASTSVGFATLAASSVTLDTSRTSLSMNPGDLQPNTTYFVRVGALFMGATTYATTVPSSTSTLTDLVTGAQVSRVNVTSVTVTWTALGAADGYRLEAYRDSGYTSLAGSSATASVSVTTLSITGLSAYTTYYLRLGGINHNSVVNWVTLSSTRTTAGLAPGNPQISAVYVSSLAVTYTGVTDHNGYTLDASTASDFSGTLITSVTAATAVTSLRFNAGDLQPNTTYFLRVGALYNGATSYAVTTPISTSTLTSPITGGQIGPVAVTSITVTWSALGSADGYRLEAYSDSGYTALAASSQTASVSGTTLTVVGLGANTTYYLRVGGLNHNNVANWTLLGGTKTTAGLAPSNVVISAVYLSSMSVTWTGVTDHGGYSLEAATAANFSGTVIASVTANTAATSLSFNLAALAPNTTYFVRVGALYNGATSYAPAAPVSTATLASSLVAAQIYRTYTSSITANWTPFAAGSGANTATGYVLEASSTAFNGTGTVYSSATASVSVSTLTIPSLQTNVLYSLRAGAINHNGVVTYVTIGNTTTSAGPAPIAPVIASVGISSMVVTWGAVASPNGYVLEASTWSGFAPLTASSVTASGSATGLAFNLGDLSPNTTYFIRAGSLWNGATSYANTAPASTSTLTSLVTGGQVGAVAVTSITVTWAALGSADGYRLEAYTDSGFTSLAGSSATASIAVTTLSVTGLNAYSTYYLRIGGLNHNNVANWVALGSTMTAAGAAPGTPMITSVWVSSLAVTWTSAANQNGYVLEASTAAGFTGTVIASATANTSLTGLRFNPGDLAPNTTYFVRAGALYNGATTYADAVPTSTSTLTSTLTGGQISGVFVTSITATWTAFGSGSGANTADGYRLEAATDAAFTAVVASSATADLSSNALALTALTPNTTYYLRVGALNHTGRFVYTVLGSSKTLVTPVPAGLAGVALGVSSISWTWNSVTGAQSYNLYSTTGGVVASGAATSFNETGLSTNTAYGRRVTAVVNGIESALSAAVTTYTQAAAPGTPAVSAVAITSFTVTWSGNGNPNTTRYEVSLSTDSAFAAPVSTPVAFASAFTGTSTALTGLIPATTYYVRVRAENNDTVPVVTAFSAAASTRTLDVPAPASLSATVLGTSSISWTWSALGGATYRLYAATGGIVASGLAGTTYAETGLTPNAAYGRQVVAVMNGVESALTAAVTTYTFAAVPGGATFTNVAITSMTITWAANANPGTTKYEVSRSTDPAFVLAVSTPIAFTDAFLATTTDFTRLLPATTYYVRIRAQNELGVTTAFSPVRSTVTLPAAALRPSAVRDLTAAPSGPGGARLTWTAPGEDGVLGTIDVGAFRIAYSTDAANAIIDAYWPTVTSYVTISTASVVPGSTHTAILSNLYGGATYYFRLWTQNSVGNWSDLSGGATTQTDVYSALALAGAGIGTSSIAWTWTDTRNLYVDGYELQTAGGAVLSTVAGGVFTVADVGLSTNTTYSRKLRAFTGGSSSTTVTSSRYTLAAVPASLSFFNVTTTGLSAAWDVNGNPAATLFTAQLSASPGFAAPSSSATVLSTASFSGLASNATYYVRVRAQNEDAVATAYTATASTITPAAVPASGAFSIVTTTSIAITWTAATNAAGTFYQAELSTISTVGTATTTVTGTALAALFTGLDQDVTYYARVKALGWAGDDSAYLVIGSTRTPLAVPAPAFTEVNTSSLTVGWASTGNGVTFEVELAPAIGFATLQSSATPDTQASFTSLLSNTLYYARARARSIRTGNYSAYSNLISTATLPLAPVLLSTTNVTTNSLSFTWNANGNPSGALYRLERSVDGVSFVTAQNVIGTSGTDYNLQPGTLYVYRVRAISASGGISAPSNEVSVRTLGTPIAPRRPTGFYAERDTAVAGTQTMKLHWTPVSTRSDGSVLTSTVSYEIYRSANVLAAEDLWTLVATVSGEEWSTTVAEDSGSYYFLKAVDGSGLRSTATHRLADYGAFDHFYFSEDGVTRIQIPDRAAIVLRRSYNSYGSDLDVELVERPEDEAGRVVRSVEVKVINEVTEAEATDVRFNSADVRGYIAYTVENGKVLQGARSRRAGTGTPVLDATQASQQLSLFWYNGNEWVKTTGYVNSSDNNVSFLSARTGRFQIRLATHASGTVLSRVYPRIITPNGDGWNDKVIFQFDNPEGLPLEGKIFDLQGSNVATLTAGPQPDSTLAWDGKDAGGAVVPSGIYLYQITIKGKVTTGTVVVAR